MKLKELIASLPIIETTGCMDKEIVGVDIDSRQVQQGHLFIALKGTAVDGHVYIDKAIAAGATAIVCEEMPVERDAVKVAYVKVESTEIVVGRIATIFFGNPTERMKLVGVTGTNGKTTVATLLYKLFRQMGHKVGLVSTVCNYIDAEAVATDHTTPDPITLNRLLARMADAGCEYAFMEVSSHAVVQQRIGGLKFAGGVFTNLTRDHLDYHKTVENYLKAKKSFFDNLQPEAFVLTNADDRNGCVMTQNTRAAVKTYSLRSMADYKGRIVEEYLGGMLIDIDGCEAVVNLMGRFNASNLLAVYGTALMLGKPQEEVLRLLTVLTPVAGRFEAVQKERGYIAVIDYAHTPDAIANVLVAIREVTAGKGRIITVTGAGGNRDKGKRPLMAVEAVKGSDVLILTSDNPRWEEPEDIIADMMTGLDDVQRTRTLSVVDRREAIRVACMMARQGDVVLIAGKGHENYQEVKGVKHHFDDKEEVEKV